jgi:hypothetical protein
MARPLPIRHPHTAALRQGHQVLAAALPPGPRCRAAALLRDTAGLAAVDIAPWLGVHPPPMSAALHVVGRYGSAAGPHGSRGGAPREPPQRQPPRDRAALRALPRREAGLLGGGP